MTRAPLFRTVAALAAALSCGSDPLGPGAPIPPLPVQFGAPASGRLAIAGVNVVPMAREEVLADRTVLIQDGTIVRIGPSDEVPIPEGTTVVDGRGRWLMPGLMDLHVHLSPEALPILLASGITMVRNMWGTATVAQLMTGVGSGDLLGPTIVSASPGLDGNQPIWPGTVQVLDPDQADEAVARLAGERRWNYLKIYQSLDRDAYDAIVKAARARGIPFVGHVPHRVGLEHVLAAGQSSVEHLGGYELALGAGARGVFGWPQVDTAGMAALARRTSDAGVTVCPTLVVLRALAERNLSPPAQVRERDNTRAMVRALVGAGVRIVAGTDAGVQAVGYGSSLHDELAEYVAAGLTPYQALRTATVAAAEFLGVDGQVGTVAEGRRADLLLVAANPLLDPATARAPVGVVLGGRWLPGS